MKDKEHSIDSHKDAVGRCMHRYKHHDPKPLHSGPGKKGKKGPVVTARKQAVAICLSIAERGGDGYSESALEEVSELLSDYGEGMVRRKKGKGCPKGTSPKGKWCLVSYPDREFYLSLEDGESCPPGTKGSGGGYCKGNYSEAPYEYAACPPPRPERTPAQQRADQQRSQQQQGDTPPIPRKKRNEGLKKAQEVRKQQKQQGCS